MLPGCLVLFRLEGIELLSGSDKSQNGKLD